MKYPSLDKFPGLAGRNMSPGTAKLLESLIGKQEGGRGHAAKVARSRARDEDWGLHAWGVTSSAVLPWSCDTSSGSNSLESQLCSLGSEEVGCLFLRFTPDAVSPRQQTDSLFSDA
ncbi:hypothetical protein CCH79_00003610 [Gambusia affinis]|uniref:Uncharacterized protein n=1 Tax=Gambusia affinis TaxID=33528 RepID=A0A315VE42_GAMAF|nr:hypothetical protein CCH79_00003610 [Gambusia affinis]